MYCRGICSSRLHKNTGFLCRFRSKVAMTLWQCLKNHANIGRWKHKPKSHFHDDQSTSIMYRRGILHFSRSLLSLTLVEDAGFICCTRYKKNCATSINAPQRIGLASVGELLWFFLRDGVVLLVTIVNETQISPTAVTVYILPRNSLFIHAKTCTVEKHLMYGKISRASSCICPRCVERWRKEEGRAKKKLNGWFEVWCLLLEASVGVNNQNWALTSTLSYYRFKTPIGLKLELTCDC